MSEGNVRREWKVDVRCIEWGGVDGTEIANSVVVEMAEGGFVKLIQLNGSAMKPIDHRIASGAFNAATFALRSLEEAKLIPKRDDLP